MILKNIFKKDAKNHLITYGNRVEIQFFAFFKYSEKSLFLGKKSSLRYDSLESTIKKH